MLGEGFEVLQMSVEHVTNPGEITAALGAMI
jgi:hypothetical protein